MDSENTPTQQPDNHMKNDYKNCRVRVLVINKIDLLECLTEVIRCQWAVPFGDGRFCNHPSAKQFTISNQP